MHLFRTTTAAALFLVIPLISEGQDQRMQPFIAAEGPELHHVCTIQPSGHDAFIYLPRSINESRKGMNGSAATAAFEITYVNNCGSFLWPADAIQAFEYATGIWSTHLRSDIPIRIEANWVTLGSNTLGSAGPTRIIRDFAGSEPGTWYTIAQASAMSGIDIVSTIDNEDFDISININCSYPNWYTGIDANTPAGRIDMVTTVLHEIGHGIGFLGSANVSNNNGSWGFSSPPLPMVYDISVRDGDGQQVIPNTALYPNPSTQLFNAFTGGRGGLYFDSFETRLVNSGNPARLYTPLEWQPGSSYSHLDQNSFGGTANRLMRPAADAAQAIHNPGPVFCAMLYTWGWPLGDDCGDFDNSDALLAASENQFDFGLTKIGNPITLNIPFGAALNSPDPVVIIAESNGTGFSIVGTKALTINPGATGNLSVRYNPRTEGIHAGSIAIRHNASNAPDPLLINLTGESLGADVIVVLNQNYPNPFNNGTTIPFDLPEESDVLLRLYNAVGQPVTTLVNNRLTPGRYEIPVDVSQWSSGVYFYQISVNNYIDTRKMMILK